MPAKQPADPPSLAQLQLDATFLKGYLGLPVKVRRIAAKHWTEVFRGTADDLLRKTALIKVYEDFVASTEDLGMFFYALKQLGEAPSGVVPHCDGFFVQANEQAWNEEIASIPDGHHFLEGHLPEHDVPYPPGTDRAFFDKAFRKLTNALKAAATTRVVGNRQFVRGANKIKHGMLILDTGESVAIDLADLAHSGLPVTEEFVERLCAATVAMRQVTAVIVSALIHKMHMSAVRRDYGLSEADNAVLMESFKDIPRTF